jgi:hypothetical protein
LSIFFLILWGKIYGLERGIGGFTYRREGRTGNRDLPRRDRGRLEEKRRRALYGDGDWLFKGT